VKVIKEVVKPKNRWRIKKQKMTEEEGKRRRKDWTCGRCGDESTRLFTGGGPSRPCPVHMAFMSTCVDEGKKNSFQISNSIPVLHSKSRVRVNYAQKFTGLKLYTCESPTNIQVTFSPYFKSTVCCTHLRTTSDNTQLNFTDYCNSLY
jgi:hypothetical protein